MSVSLRVTCSTLAPLDKQTSTRFVAYGSACLTAAMCTAVPATSAPVAPTLPAASGHSLVVQWCHERPQVISSNTNFKLASAGSCCAAAACPQACSTKAAAQLLYIFDGAAATTAEASPAVTACSWPCLIAARPSPLLLVLNHQLPTSPCMQAVGDRGMYAPVRAAITAMRAKPMDYSQGWRQG